jgi:hypothetical protein
MKEIKVKKAMAPQQGYSAVSRGATLFDVITELDASRPRSHKGTTGHDPVLILDENKKVVGKLTYADVPQGSYIRVGDECEVVDAARRLMAGKTFHFS